LPTVKIPTKLKAPSALKRHESATRWLIVNKMPNVLFVRLDFEDDNIIFEYEKFNNEI